jgi:hypothetical protein
MKSTTYLFTIASCTILLLSAACKKPYDYDKEIGAPKYSIENLNTAILGKWVMSEAKQTDEKSLTKEAIDITDFFIADGASAPNITFSATGNSFTIDTTGLLINFFSVDNGKWKFDDLRYPTKIELTDVNDNMVGSIEIGSNLLGFTPKLNYVSSAKCSGDVVMSYSVLFNKSK